MFGAFMDAAMSIPNNMFAEEQQNDAQQFSYGQGELSREFNSAQAVAQRDWQERLSNTAHQRAAADLEKAGLNRILAIRQGGAVTGGGASGSSSAASAGMASTNNHANFTQGEINSAQAELLDEQTGVAAQTKWNVSADTERKKQETNLLMQQQETEKERTKRERHEAAIAGHSAVGAELDAGINETTYGKIMRYIDRIRGSGAYRDQR